MTSDNETISGDIYIGGGETEGMRLITKAIKETQKNSSRNQISSL